MKRNTFERICIREIYSWKQFDVILIVFSELKHEFALQQEKRFHFKVSDEESKKNE